MSKQSLRVTFLKSTCDLSLKEGSNILGGDNKHNESYLYRSPEGEAYLIAAGGYFGRIKRYYFRKGDVTSPFCSQKDMDAYMARINNACGEVVAVPVAA